jgi:nucleotide-binding universal stress UspA family protein
MYPKILIATDGSDTAKRAVALGAELADALGGETLILHVGDDARGKTVLADAQKAVPGAQTRTVPGDAADQICEVAERENIDLIVVGNKGMTGAKRFLLGSVPNQVSHHSPCDVFIVKTT